MSRVTKADEARACEVIGRCIEDELWSGDYLYRIFGSRSMLGDKAKFGWRGIALVFCADSREKCDDPYVAATLAENVPWKILKRAGELGERMEKLGVSVVEFVPGWCDPLDEPLPDIVAAGGGENVAE